MKKAPVVEAAPRDRTVLWIGVSAGLAVILFTGVLLLGSRATAMELRARESITRYEKMKDSKRAIFDLKRKGGNKPKLDERPEGLAAFLSKTANDVGLPAASVTFKNDQRQKSGGWEESPITATVSVTKDAPIAHGVIVAYLAAVEKNSSLKAKNLTLGYSGSDFQSVTITFSYYRRES